MLKRFVTDQLQQWKLRPDRKCLMVRGARQIGKTYAIEHFGKKAYASCITINFLKNPSLKKIFAEDLDPKRLLMNISLYLPGEKLIRGDTLLFLDEIQECPEAITSLKFWNEEPDFDVIASGSMLGIDYKRPKSFPVGALEYIDMHSLSFEDFLWAFQVNDDILELLRNAFNTRTAVPFAIHDRMMQLLRLYSVLGGMPEVLTKFLETDNLQAADEKQRAILQDYRYDIAHYANADIKIKAEKCYFSLPEQLSKDNHKFQFSTVEKGGTARKYGSSLDWLEGAYMITRVPNLNSYDLPLRSSENAQSFRVYATDIGLFLAMFDTSVKERILYPEKTDQAHFKKGGLYEALVADLLIKNGHKELFFRKDEASTLEIEFLMKGADGAIPIEVKSTNSRSKSLDHLLERPEIPYGYKLIDGNAGQMGKKITLPLYMGMFL